MFRPPTDLRSIEASRVCLIKPSALGDIVHALPVLAALRARWPSAHIAWVVNAGLRGLLDGNPCVDEVIAFDRGTAGRFPRGIRTLLDLRATLAARRFDLTIDLQGLLRSGLISAATGARVRVGLSDAREGATAFYSHRVLMPREPTHIVDRLLLVAGAFAADTARPRWPLPRAPEDAVWAVRTLAAVRWPRLVMNMGARWLTKRWPPEQFAEVASRAIHELGAGVVVVGAREDAPIVEKFHRTLSPEARLYVKNVCGATTLPQLTAIASQCDLFLSNDTGPLHLAAATGARVIGIYTCTDPRRTGPYGPRATFVQSGVWCAASRVKQCARLDCMCELSPNRVWDAVEPVLRAAAPLPPHAA
jgi:lipopolysaccharide heptosyltransferase I